MQNRPEQSITTIPDTPREFGVSIRPQVAIHPLKLAQVNFDLFCQLRSMNSNRSNICRAMSLSAQDFDDLVTLMDCQFEML